MSARSLDAWTVGLAVLVLLHAGIHLLGLSKAFGWAALPELPPISRAWGVVWLAAAALLGVAGVSLLSGAASWWLAAAPGLVLSELAIISAWSAAKWGTLPNLVLLLPVALAAVRALPSSFDSQLQQELRSAVPQPQPAVLADTDLARLPAVVRAYVRSTGAVGKPRVTSFRLRFRGQMVTAPGESPMSFEAEQVSRIHPASRTFLMRARRFGVPFVAFHHYAGSSATMEVKVADLFRVFDARGPKMDQSETVTLLNDLCVFAPGALPFVPIAWEELSPDRVKATFENAGHRVSAVLSFDRQQRLVNFHSDDRYQTSDGRTFHLYRWSTPLSDYRDYGGVRVAARGDATWHMPEGELVYGRFELVDLRYNEVGERR